MPMDYSDNTMTQAVNIEKIFSEFFHNVKAALRRLNNCGSSSQFVGSAEQAMLDRVETAKAAVRMHLMDDFDTPRAVSVLTELVRDSNKYMENSPATVSSVVLNSIARYITSILRTFGLVQDGCEIGFPMSDNSDVTGGSKEQILSPFLDVLTDFRKSVRVAAMAKDSKMVLDLVDRLRDEVLPNLGVRMEDKGSGSAADTVWKLEDVEVLKKERAQKEIALRQKEEQKKAAAILLAQREEAAKISPESMFRHMVDKYSAFDERGIPTKDAAGEELTKNALKKLTKEFDRQKEAHDKYLAKSNNDINNNDD